MKHVTEYGLAGWSVGLLLTVVVSAFVQQPALTYLGMLLGGMGVLAGVEYGLRYGRL